MSNKKKPKKLRTPNVPTKAAPAAVTAVAAAAPVRTRGGGQELPSQTRVARAMPAAVAQANFDYTYVKKDLSRIAVLAGSFIVVLVILSFFIK